MQRRGRTGACTSAQVRPPAAVFAVVNPRTSETVADCEPGSELGWTTMGWTASARATDGISFGSWCSRIRAGSRIASTSTPTSRAPRTDDANNINALDPDCKRVPRSRRQADSVPRLERSADLAGQQRAVLPAGAEDDGRGARCTIPIVCSWRRAWRTAAAATARIRSTWSALEQWVEQGKAPDRIVASHATARHRRSHATAVPVSAGGELHRNGQHGRRRQLRLQDAVARSPAKAGTTYRTPPTSDDARSASPCA